MIEWLAEEEWKPKEGDIIKIDNINERIFLYTTNTGRHLVVCHWGEDDYREGKHFYSEAYKKIFPKSKEEKKERKLMMTDSEWERLKTLIGK